jgi:hypothetical protein
MPKPTKGENEELFLKRCIPQLIREGRDVKQAAAICYSVYRKEGTETKSPKPKRKNLSKDEKTKLLLIHY